MVQSLGLIAGSGQLPILFARKAKEKNLPLFIVAVRGAANPALEKMATESLWISIGQLGSLLSFFKKKGVKRAAMHGKVQHSALLKHPRFDLKAISLLAKLKDRSGESVLKSLAEEMGRNGTKLLDGRYLMDDLLAEPGWLVGKDSMEPAFNQGLEKARLLARLRIGQSLLLKKNTVVAVEAVEGTDETIQRAGRWAGPGTVLYKAASPLQDFRFDIPTIGPKTIEVLAKIKAKGAVIEAKKVFVLDREKTIKMARNKGLFVLSL